MKIFLSFDKGTRFIEVAIFLY